MIAAVNGRVAIGARAQQQLLRRGRATGLHRQTAAAQCGRGVQGARVTALAQPRRPHFQQWGDVRSVRNMAVAAIVGGRRMLPQERAPLLGVTAVAGLVDGVFDKQLRPRRAMRIMAIRASDPACRNRMRGKVTDLRALGLVTGKADFALRVPREGLIIWLMDCMA